tara:strand:- start:159 stop:635 length:477 start_codon:yes stop_codon:yes gene_type:complete
MFFVSKIKHLKIFIYILMMFILSNCQLKEPIKSHGINFLENRSNKIITYKSNKNDVIGVLGNPHTKSINDDNIWFYFDRKMTNNSIINLKKNKLLENNVLVIGFNNRGIVDNKKFFTKKDMKRMTYVDKTTANPVSNQSFVTKFLQSVKQKMYGKRKF